MSVGEVFGTHRVAPSRRRLSQNEKVMGEGIGCCSVQRVHCVRAARKSMPYTWWVELLWAVDDRDYILQIAALPRCT